jgi:hypothetical protein
VNVLRNGVAKEGGYDCADYRSRGRAGFEQFEIWRTRRSPIRVVLGKKGMRFATIQMKMQMIDSLSTRMKPVSLQDAKSSMKAVNQSEPWMGFGWIQVRIA